MFFAFLLCFHILNQNIVFVHFLLNISLDSVLYSFCTYFLNFLQKFILGFNGFQIHQIGSSSQLHFFVVVLGEGLPYELVFIVLHEGVVLSLGGETSVEIFFYFEQIVVLTFFVILLELWLYWHIFCDLLVGLLIFLRNGLQRSNILNFIEVLHHFILLQGALLSLVERILSCIFDFHGLDCENVGLHFTSG